MLNAENTKKKKNVIYTPHTIIAVMLVEYFSNRDAINSEVSAIGIEKHIVNAVFLPSINEPTSLRKVMKFKMEIIKKQPPVLNAIA